MAPYNRGVRACPLSSSHWLALRVRRLAPYRPDQRLCKSRQSRIALAVQQGSSRVSPAVAAASITGVASETQVLPKQQFGFGNPNSSFQTRPTSAAVPWESNGLPEASVLPGLEAEVQPAERDATSTASTSFGSPDWQVSPRMTGFNGVLTRVTRKDGAFTHLAWQQAQLL